MLYNIKRERMPSIKHNKFIDLVIQRNSVIIMNSNGPKLNIKVA